jgi:hypothetical protein
LTARDLGAALPEAPYYPDFYLLTQCDVLAIPNSTFSVVAAMLSERLRWSVRTCLKEPLDHPPFRPFDPWDDVFLDTAAEAEQFPHIPGLLAPPTSPASVAPRWKQWLRRQRRRSTWSLDRRHGSPRWKQWLRRLRLRSRRHAA